jgi:hypothetical protein
MSQCDGHHGARKEHSHGEYDRQDQRSPQRSGGVITDNDRLKSEGQTDQVRGEVALHKKSGQKSDAQVTKDFLVSF